MIRSLLGAAAILACISITAFGRSEAAGAARGDMAHACAFHATKTDFPPVASMEGPQSYGSDRAAEPFTLAIMEGGAAWRGLGDRSAAAKAIGWMREWARAGALEKVVDAGSKHSNTNSIYSLRRALIPLLANWQDLKSAANAEDAGEVEAWLARLVAAQDTDTGSAKGRGGRGAVSNRNNHVYLRATVDALWAQETHDRARAAKAAEIVTGALLGMRPDGSLPLETARGARALWYQRQAVGSLVVTSEILRGFGYDGWARRGDGHSLHDAVAFLAAATRDPALVAGYAAANKNPKPGTRPDVQDLGFLEPRGNGRHYMAWTEYYRARFPTNPSVAMLDGLIRPSLAQARPMIDDFAGGNATCRALTAPKGGRR